MKRTLFSTLLACCALLFSSCDSTTDRSELIVTDLVEGNGAVVSLGHTLITTYVGRFADGTQFDSSDELGEDWIFTLGVGQVIKGWDQGLEGMRVGGTRRLEIPSHLAFGRSGQCFSDGTCAVPANTDVIYDVTVVDIFDEVQIEDEVEGDGEVADPGDVLIVDYVGQLRDGSVFDASANTGAYFVFTLGNGSVIPGWDQGMVGMKEGGVRWLTIPPVLAYGAYGSSRIPPYAVLKFKVSLVEVCKQQNSTCSVG